MSFWISPHLHTGDLHTLHCRRYFSRFWHIPIRCSKFKVPYFPINFVLSDHHSFKNIYLSRLRMVMVLVISSDVRFDTLKLPSKNLSKLMETWSKRYYFAFPKLSISFFFYVHFFLIHKSPKTSKNCDHLCSMRNMKTFLVQTHCVELGIASM